jgi:hypothetical protein
MRIGLSFRRDRSCSRFVISQDSDRFTIGLAAVDHDPHRPTMTLEGLAQKSFGRSQVAPLAEPELDRVTMAVNGAIEIPPLASTLIYVSSTCHLAVTARLWALKRFRSSGEYRTTHL